MATATPLSGSFPLTVSFTGSGSTDDIGISTFNWDFGDGGASSIVDTDHTYTSAGLFTASLTVEDTDGQRSTSTVTINVSNPNPLCNGVIIPEYRVNGEWLSGSNELTVPEGTELMFSMLPNGIGVTVEYPDGRVFGDDYLLGEVSVTDSGAYKLTSAQGCITIVDLNVEGLSLVARKYNYKDDDTNYENLVFPNPTSGKIKVGVSEYSLKNIDVKLFSIYGSLVFEKSFEVKNEKFIDLNFYNLVDGLYILKIYSDKKVKHFKIIVFN